ncbi:2Fe-2S iron-sulfur cluster-binding protein [Methylocystis bryophila]|uniref:Ferredoxin n=1 Tax=Methylocystis bryophila TaxID=655015 RepID=A0A1W6N010_9HYPH|nr:2Fe-2S iron-sulfur cluster-binding protein [Methylocystis bryophila]ARN83168.1 ferredoxin [Methylocystis bryophila]BDV39502.1 ferredoxin [Methylocystis bryophila]
MASFTLETREGARSEVKAKDGVTLMKLIRRSGAEELVAQCGGSCACATCHVYVSPREGVTLPPMRPDESRMLATAGERRMTSRLACQIKFDAALDGMHVTIAPENLDDI